MAEHFGLKARKRFISIKPRNYVQRLFSDITLKKIFLSTFDQKDEVAANPILY